MRDQPDLSLATLLRSALTAGAVPLPVHPATRTRSARLLQGERPTVAELAVLAGTDPALACHLFRAANSAFYSGLPKTRTLDEAILRIGVAESLRVVTKACQGSESSHPGLLTARYLEPLWRHSLGCAIGASWFADRCGYPDLAGSAHLAGLLHDIGKWQLLAALARLGRDGHGDNPIGEQLVEEILASLHVELGMQLVAEWNLPDGLDRVVGRHHQSGRNDEGLVVTLVRLANLGCRKLGLGWVCDPGLVLPTTVEAQVLGLDEIALAEYEIMLEDRFDLPRPTIPEAS
jgi:HD-like signal output (HDOD) protein